ncbi:MAG: tetratricopeptide repeat protein [Alphaproteobacteria bacterium]|nr:tetratricopeptide repeat protein [Alphaproteobacteria bacterium]
MTDLFEEVEEQLRSDRYRALALKALPWILGLGAAALIAVLAYWGWQAYSRKQDAKASDEYSQALDDMAQGDRAAAQKLWTDVSQSHARAYKSLALMQLGGLALSDKKIPDAVKLFDEAAKAAPDPIIGDAARLKSAFALLDTAPEQEMEARLAPLMKDGRPYRIQAREALAFTKLMAGDMAGARSEFLLISQSLDAPNGARERAGAAINLIDSGSAKAIPQVAKAAAALPEPATPAPGPAAANPASQNRASQNPGPQASGPQTPSSQTRSSQTPSSQTPASHNPGSHNPPTQQQAPGPQ